MTKKEIYKKNRIIEKMIKSIRIQKPISREIKWTELKNGKIVKHTDLTAW